MVGVVKGNHREIDAASRVQAATISHIRPRHCTRSTPLRAKRRHGRRCRPKRAGRFVPNRSSFGVVAASMIAHGQVSNPHAARFDEQARRVGFRPVSRGDRANDGGGGAPRCRATQAHYGFGPCCHLSRKKLSCARNPRVSWLRARPGRRPNAHHVDPASKTTAAWPSPGTARASPAGPRPAPAPWIFDIPDGCFPDSGFHGTLDLGRRRTTEPRIDRPGLGGADHEPETRSDVPRNPEACNGGPGGNARLHADAQSGRVATRRPRRGRRGPQVRHLRPDRASTHHAQQGRRVSPFRMEPPVPPRFAADRARVSGRPT